MNLWLKRLKIEGEDWLRYNAFARGRLSDWKLLRDACSAPKDPQAVARSIRDLCTAARLTTRVGRVDDCMGRIRRRLNGLDPARVDWSEFVPGLDDPRLSKAVFLKPYISEREKGVLFISFETEWARLMRHCDLKAVAGRYALVLGPSSSPPHSLINYVFPAAFPGTLFTLISNNDDRGVLPRVAPNFEVVPLFASSWVHPGLVRPLPRSRRDIDLIMVANFAKFKRHHALLRALRRMPKGLRIQLIGQDQDGRTGETLSEMACCFGVEDRFRLLTDAPWETVIEYLCRSRASVILSRREGSCVVVAESLFADTPVALLEGAEIGSRAFINPATGRLLKDGDLAGQLAAFVTESDGYAPRRWADEHITCFESSRILNDAVRRRQLADGQEWTRDLAPMYRRPEPRLALPEDRLWLRQERKEFEGRFGVAIGDDEA
jgi:glycosyltransferase involved in cell wall biosynthesis